MWDGEQPANFLRVVARSIQNAVTEHEQRLHGLSAALAVPESPPPKPELHLLEPGERRRPRTAPEAVAIIKRGERSPELAAEDIGKVDALAHRTLREGSCSRPPVPANLVALLDPGHQVEIREVAMERYIPGSHRCFGDRWIILVNREYGVRSRRFTVLAHGFLLLWESGGIELESRASGLYWLASRFASRVLMPERWIREIWPKVQGEVAMAGIFEVSVPAMRIRMQELGLLN